MPGESATFFFFYSFSMKLNICIKKSVIGVVCICFFLNPNHLTSLLSIILAGEGGGQLLHKKQAHLRVCVVSLHRHVRCAHQHMTDLLRMVPPTAEEQETHPGRTHPPPPPPSSFAVKHPATKLTSLFLFFLLLTPSTLCPLGLAFL